MSQVSSQTATNKQFFLNQDQPGSQVAACQVLAVTAGSTSVFTVPAGSDVIITSVHVINDTAITGANTVALSRVSDSAVLVAAATHGTAINLTTTLTPAATNVRLRAGDVVQVTLATGTAGRIKVVVNCIAVPL